MQRNSNINYCFCNLPLDIPSNVKKEKKQLLITSIFEIFSTTDTCCMHNFKIWFEIILKVYINIWKLCLDFWLERPHSYIYVLVVYVLHLLVKHISWRCYRMSRRRKGWDWSLKEFFWKFDESSGFDSAIRLSALQIYKSIISLLECFISY